MRRPLHIIAVLIPLLAGCVAAGGAPPATSPAPVVGMTNPVPDKLPGAEAIDAAIRTLRNAHSPVARRTAAAELLGRAPFERSGEALGSVLAPIHPTRLQIVAVRALACLDDDRVGPALLEPSRWRVYTPLVRASVITNLLAQPRHLSWLLTALESEQIAFASLTLAQWDALKGHTHEPTRLRATGVWQRIHAGDRMKAFEAMRPVLELKGATAKGPELFKKHCVSCHRLDGEGANVGSDLEPLRTKPADYLLLHTVVPEYEILPEFTGYVVDLKDDRTLTGLINSETDETLTIRQSQGEEVTFRREELATLMATTLSLMPQELEKNMTRQELADLLAWIRKE